MLRLKLARTLALLVPCWLFGLHAQTNDYEGRTIRAIEYQPAEQPLTPGELTRAQTLKVGQPLRKDDVTTAIDKLFASGRYTDIQVEVTPGDDGVTVRFVTQFQSFFSHFWVHGRISDPPSTGMIEDATQLRLGTPFEPEEMAKADPAILDLFQRNGLYEAQVTHRLVPLQEAQQMMIVFEVRPGKRARFETPVIEGDVKLPLNSIIKATSWRRPIIGGWKPLTESRVTGGILGVQRLYQKKGRLTAKVQLKSLEYNAVSHTVKPTISVEAGPNVIVRAVEAKISKRTLRKYVPIYDEQAVDRDLLVEGARNLRDYYQAQGYYQADIDFRELPETKNDQLTIEYVVSKGKRYKLVHLDITGNKYFSKHTVEERLIVRTASFPAFRNGRYSEAYRQRDEENIANLYRSNGFRNVKVVSSVKEDYDKKSGDIAVTYTIEEGPQWRVRNLEVLGLGPAAAKVVTPQFVSSAGQPFSEFNVAADRKEILGYYFGHGYPSAAFQWKFVEADTPTTVDVTYQIDEGPQRFVRDVLITGLERTRRKLVNDALTVHAGDPLSLIAITDTQRQLYNQGVFAKVQTAVQDQRGAGNEKYVQFDMDEASRYTLRVGVGADISRFGPSTMDLTQADNSTGFSPRFSLELSRLNLFGLGHTVSFQGRVSTLEQRALVNYYLPRFRNVAGRNITFTVLYDYSRDVRTFTAKREEASVQVSQRFTKAVNALFQFAYRRVSTGNIEIPSLLIPQLVQPIRIGILSANLVQDRRDNPTNATRGVFNTIDVGLASKAFGSQRNFARALARNATYYKLSRDLVLARETTFGVLVPFSVPNGTSSADAVPLPERFFGGGGQSDRGFPENQAGPRDIGMAAGPNGMSSEPTGFPLGGNALFFNSVELRFPLLGENIGGVFFHDMGNIFDKVGDLSFRFSQPNNKDFNYMVHAVGFGVRYKTPVGPLRLDLAYSINPPRYIGFNGTYQQLLLCNPQTPATNPPYCAGVPQQISHFQFFFSIGQAF